MVCLIYNSGKKKDKGRNIYEMQCSHSRFKIKMLILQTRYSTCFCSQWLWPLLGYQPVCHQTRNILLTNFQHILQTKKREKPKQAIPAYRGELVQKFLPAQHKIQCCQVYANVFGSTLLPLRIIIIQIHSFGKHKKNCKQEKKYLVALHVGCNIT